MRSRSAWSRRALGSVGLPSAASAGTRLRSGGSSSASASATGRGGPMCAIDLHIGTQDPEDRDTELVCDIDGEPLGDLEAARACIPSLESMHNGLTRTVFIRRTIEELLAGRQVYIADGGSVGKDAAKERTSLYFVVDPPFHKYDIPWMPAA